MRKLLLILMLLIPTAAAAQTAGFNGFCYQGATSALTSGLPSTNKLQGLIPQCTVSVYLTGTVTLATIYQDSSDTPLTNPFKADQLAKWLFYAATGQGYDVVMTGGIPPPASPYSLTLTDLIIGGGGPPFTAYVNGIALLQSGSVNLINSSSITVTNPSTNQIQFTVVGGGGGGCSTGGIPTTNGSVTGDNSSTNCGYENRVGDTAAVPANVSTFGYLNSANNSATDLVVAGDTNGAYTSGHDGVFVGDMNVLGTVTQPCPIQWMVVEGNNNLSNCANGSLYPDNDGVVLGDSNEELPTPNTINIRNFQLVGVENLLSIHGSSGTFDTISAMGFNNFADLTGGGELIALGDTCIGGISTGSNLEDVVCGGDAAGSGIPDGSHDLVFFGDGSGAGGRNLSGDLEEAIAIGLENVVDATGQNIIGVGQNNIAGLNPSTYSTGSQIAAIGNTNDACNTSGSHIYDFGEYNDSNGFTGSACGDSNTTGSHHVLLGENNGSSSATQLNYIFGLGTNLSFTQSGETMLGDPTQTSLVVIYGTGDGCLSSTSGVITGSGPCGATSPLTTKGDIYVYSSTNTRLPVGTNGQILSANSAQTTGLQWINALSNPMTSVGDVITGGASGVATRVAANTTTNAYCLVETGTGSAGQAPVWSACSGSSATALSSVSAASTNATIANANNPIVWNWAQTSNSQAAFTFGETSAATGTGDQELVVSTATGSTAVPLTVTDSLNSAQTIPAVQILPTWNTTGVVDAALLVNVTNTASGAASKLFDLQVGGSSKFAVDKSGNLTLAGTNPATSVGGITVSGTPSAGNVLTATSSTAADWAAPAAAGTSGQIQYNSSGAFAGFTMSGDATIVPSTGVITVTKSNGTAFGTAAFATLGTTGSDVPQLSSGLLNNSVVNWAAPSAIGTGTPAAGTFSALTLSSITGSAQCLHVNSSGVVLGTGADCGSGGSGVPGGSSGQIQWNNGGVFAGLTLSGDATLVASTGVITVTKSNGTAFGTAAFATLGNTGTDVPQLSAGLLNNSVINWASPNAIGTTAPAAGTFSAITDTALTGYVFANGASIFTASTTIPGSAITGNIPGNAANFYGTPTLPTGTKAATGTLGENDTNVATNAQVYNATHSGTQTLCSGTITLTGGTPIASGAKTSAFTATCTGLATTDNISLDFNGDPTGITGFIPSSNGMLTILKFPASNTIEVYEINNTAAPITPGTVVLNFHVYR